MRTPARFSPKSLTEDEELARLWRREKKLLYGRIRAERIQGKGGGSGHTAGNRHAGGPGGRRIAISRILPRTDSDPSLYPAKMARGSLSTGDDVVEIQEVFQEEVPLEEVPMRVRGRDVGR
jgi:hypothetical protein